MMYDQGSEFIGHEFRKYLIEREYGITSKPSNLEYTISNVILERFHQVLGNLVQNFTSTPKYVDEDDPRSVILAALEFEIRSTTNRFRGYSFGK